MLDNYEPVSERLARWLDMEHNGQPRILTDMVSQPGTDVCVFRAELWVDQILIATGWAEEIRGQGNVNRTSHVENCETSAIGRALANAGVAGSDPARRASREEMQKASWDDWRSRPSDDDIRKAFAPDNSPPSTTGYKNHSNPPASTTVRGPMTGAASEKQIGYIMGACKRDGIVPPAWVKNLSKQDASSFIEAHKNGEAISAILERLGSDEEPF